MDEVFMCLGEAKWFISLDLESEYRQIRIKEADKFKTGFITSAGLYEWNKMPFGLINAPFTFQRVMSHIFKRAMWETVLVYLDDILIFTEDKEKHIEVFKWVVQQLEKYGLRLKAKKCCFGVRNIDFLGFIVSCGEILVSTQQKERALKLNVPINISELRSVLGFTAFFKRFIPNYTTLTAPITKHLRKGKFCISAEDKGIVEELSKAISEAKGLALPDFKRKFILYTDASSYAIGGVLVQERREEETPVTWTSSPLNAAELNETVTEKECLAVVWCVGLIE